MAKVKTSIFWQQLRKSITECDLNQFYVVEFSERKCISRFSFWLLLPNFRAFLYWKHTLSVISLCIYPYFTSFALQALYKMAILRDNDRVFFWPCETYSVSLLLFHDPFTVLVSFVLSQKCMLRSNITQIMLEFIWWACPLCSLYDHINRLWRTTMPRWELWIDKRDTSIPRSNEQGMLSDEWEEIFCVAVQCACCISTTASAAVLHNTFEK